MRERNLLLNTTKIDKSKLFNSDKVIFIWVFFAFQIPIFIIHLQTYIPFFNSWSYDSAHFFTQIDNILSRGYQDKFLPNNYSEYSYGEIPYNHNPNYQRFIGLLIYLIFNRNDKYTSFAIAEIVLISLLLMAYQAEKYLNRFQIAIIFITVFTYTNFLITLLSPYRAILLVIFPLVFMTVNMNNFWARTVYLTTFLFDPILALLSVTSLVISFRKIISKDIIKTIIFNSFTSFIMGAMIFLCQIVSYFGWTATFKEFLHTLNDRTNWNGTPNFLLGNSSKIEDVIYLFVNEFPVWFWFGLIFIAATLFSRNNQTIDPGKILSKVVLCSFVVFLFFTAIIPNYSLGLQGAPGGYLPGYMPFSIWPVMLLPIAIILSINWNFNKFIGSFKAGVVSLILFGVMFINGREFIQFFVDKHWNQDIINIYISENNVKSRVYMDFDPTTFVARNTGDEAKYISKASESVVMETSQSNENDFYLLACEDNFYLEYQNYMYPQSCEVFFKEFSCPSMTRILKNKDAEIRRCRND